MVPIAGPFLSLSLKAMQHWQCSIGNACWLFSTRSPEVVMVGREHSAQRALGRWVPSREVDPSIRFSLKMSESCCLEDRLQSCVFYAFLERFLIINYAFLNFLLSGSVHLSPRPYAELQDR